MKKRYTGRSSASLADGRVVFPGDIVDLSVAKWHHENSHLADQFVDAEPVKAAAASKPSKSDTKE